MFSEVCFVSVWHLTVLFLVSCCCSFVCLLLMYFLVCPPGIFLTVFSFSLSSCFPSISFHVLIHPVFVGFFPPSLFLMPSSCYLSCLISPVFPGVLLTFNCPFCFLSLLYACFSDLFSCSALPRCLFTRCFSLRRFSHDGLIACLFICLFVPGVIAEFSWGSFFPGFPLVSSQCTITEGPFGA